MKLPFEPVIVPALVVPSPQSIVASNWLGLADGRRSVTVATWPEKRTPSVAATESAARDSSWPALTAAVELALAVAVPGVSSYVEATRSSCRCGAMTLRLLVTDAGRLFRHPDSAGGG